MRRWIRRVVGLIGMLFCAAVLAGASTKPVDIRDLMTVTQFDKAGLNKLSPDEIKALNSWLNQYLQSRTAKASRPVVPTAAAHNSVKPAAIPPAAVAPAVISPPAPAAPAVKVLAPQSASAASIANFGAETMKQKKIPQEPSRIESRIAGTFTGWTGNTEFKLENGQIWKQAATGYFTNVKLDHPEVVIKKLTFGYLLTLPGHGETVFVRRIK